MRMGTLVCKPKKNLFNVNTWFHYPKVKKRSEVNLLDFDKDKFFGNKKAEDTKSSAKKTKKHKNKKI